LTYSQKGSRLFLKRGPTVEKPKQFAKAKFNGKRFDPTGHYKLLYDHEWENYSKEFLKHNQYCFSCGDYADVADHIEAHKGDKDKFWKLDNLMPLCHVCHNTVTRRFDMRVKPLLEEKLKWIMKNRNTNNVNTRIKVVPR
jgi:hypothetical protein